MFFFFSYFNVFAGTVSTFVFFAPPSKRQTSLTFHQQQKNIENTPLFRTSSEPGTFVRVGRNGRNGKEIADFFLLLSSRLSLLPFFPLL